MVDSAKKLIAEYENDELTIVRDDKGSAVVLKLAGRLTWGESSQGLESQIRAIVEKGGTNRIVVDLTGVSYINSMGLGTLVSAFTYCANAGVELVLSGL